jgi:hypothetical protein
LCWKLDVPNGRPLWQCDEQYSFESCTYFLGQVFAAIPLLQYFEQASGFVLQIIENPLSTLFSQALDKSCDLLACGNPLWWGCRLCKTAQYGMSLAAVGEDLIRNTGDRFKAAGFDLCDEALKPDPSYGNLKSPGQGLGKKEAEV